MGWLLHLLHKMGTLEPEQTGTPPSHLLTVTNVNRSINGQFTNFVLAVVCDVFVGKVLKNTVTARQTVETLIAAAIQQVEIRVLAEGALFYSPVDFTDALDLH